MEDMTQKKDVAETAQMLNEFFELNNICEERAVAGMARVISTYMDTPIGLATFLEGWLSIISSMSEKHGIKP